MIYYRGTRKQFDEWEKGCRIIEGIPLDGSGKINQVRGKDAPDNQRTVCYSTCIPHPDNASDVIWNPAKYTMGLFTPMTFAEVVGIGFIEVATS